MTSERELEALASLHVCHTPALNQDRSPGLGEWCSQLWSGENVIAQVYGSTPDEAHRLATEFARRLQPARVPEGWQLVPIVPTSYMIESSTGGQHFRTADCEALGDERDLLRRQWSAMLAAAPAAEGGLAEAVAWQRQTSANGSDWTDWQHYDEAERPAVIWTPATLGSSAQPHIARYRPLGVIATPAPESPEADKPEAGQREGEA